MCKVGKTYYISSSPLSHTHFTLLPSGHRVCVQRCCRDHNFSDDNCSFSHFPQAFTSHNKGLGQERRLLLTKEPYLYDAAGCSFFFTYYGPCTNFKHERCHCIVLYWVSLRQMYSSFTSAVPLIIAFSVYSPLDQGRSRFWRGQCHRGYKSFTLSTFHSQQLLYCWAPYCLHYLCCIALLYISQNFVGVYCMSSFISSFG